MGLYIHAHTHPHMLTPHRKTEEKSVTVIYSPVERLWAVKRINTELLLSVQHGFKGHELPSAASSTVPGTGELLISGPDPYKIPFY